MFRLLTTTGAFVAVMTGLAMMTSQAVSAMPTAQRVYELDERDADGNFGWIVRYKKDVNITRFNRQEWLKKWYKKQHLVMAASAHGTMKLGWNRDIFSGFSGRIADKTVEELKKDPQIDYVIKDSRVFANKLKKRSNAPWGLQRISQREPLTYKNAKAENFTYIFDDSAGEGVDVYVIDTGIRVTHKQFEGRASWGATFGTGTPNEDKDGHGTHCAGTIAGRTVGVARKARVIAVKVLGDDGSGMTSDIISGINYVMQAATNSSRPSVLSMSLGGDGNEALDDAVRGALAAGLHVIVAAGNEASDAKTSSPARVKEAITVGASDINDAVAEFSNFGELVDVFGPGVDIISASNEADDKYQSLSGTSMATPHVAGLTAYLIALEGQRTPAEMLARIQALGSDGLLKLMPAKTRNDLMYNGAALKPVKATKTVPKVNVHPASAPIPTGTGATVNLVPKVDS